MNAALGISSAFEPTAAKHGIYSKKIHGAAKLAQLKRLTYIAGVGIQAPRGTKEP